MPPRSGGKIAALKAGLGDLESRLRLGPNAPVKKEEPVEDQKKEEPLVDVRKSRARGPRGRKLPTKEEKVEAAVGQVKGNEIVGVWTVFTLDEDLDAVVIGTRRNGGRVESDGQGLQLHAQFPNAADAGGLDGLQNRAAICTDHIVHDAGLSSALGGRLSTKFRGGAVVRVFIARIGWSSAETAHSLEHRVASTSLH